MKIRHFLTLVGLALLASFPVRLCAASATHALGVEILPRFADAPLTFDSFINTNVAGQRLSVTRLDFLLSGMALRRVDGTWLPQSNGFACINGRKGRTAFELANLPAGNYDRVRFNIGVPAKENHADPAGLASDHPLNPNVNGLHWSWQGGYVFFALEGNWPSSSSTATRGADNFEGRAASKGALPADAGTPNQRISGYSYHLANDRLLMTVELPLELDLNSDHELRLALNIDRIFSSRHCIRLSEATTSTHSRADDPLAGQLRENVESAFTIDRIRAAQPTLAPARSANKVEIAATATPYRLTFPGFFPRPALPLDNPLTEEGVELGRRLFNDPLLSINNSQACASCHEARSGFAENKRVSTGAEGATGARNAMPLFNLAWKTSFFWDGRTPSLREQVLQPIQNPIEMHESLTNIVVKLVAASIPPSSTYPELFARAFGTREINADRIARALEQFLLIQVSHDSKFDFSLAGKAELTTEERRGFELFHTEYDPRRGQFGADCFHCHGGPLFLSQGFANNGLDSASTDVCRGCDKTLCLHRDLGRYEWTGKNGDKGKFAVPSLRNVAITAPYMHDGRFETLEQVLDHYSTGVKRSATLDPNLAKHPDGGVPLSAEDKGALVAFLKTLTDERFVDRAFAVTK